MEKDVPDTKHTQQDNVSFTKAVRLAALTTASEQPWITPHTSLAIFSYMLPGWSSSAPLCSVRYHTEHTHTNIRTVSKIASGMMHVLKNNDAEKCRRRREEVQEKESAHHGDSVRCSGSCAAAYHPCGTYSFQRHLPAFFMPPPPCASPFTQLISCCYFSPPFFFFVH